MIPGAKVFLLIPRVLKELEGKEGVRLFGRSTQIECRLTKEIQEGFRSVYSIQPITNPPGKYYYEIQAEEGWEPNTGQVVTNMSGQKLNPRWGGWKKQELHRAGFRSSRELVTVKAYTVRTYGTFTRFLLTQEGREKLLVVEIIGQFAFSAEKNEIVTTEKEEHEHLIPAAKAAIGRAVCNCPKKGCASHYAMTQEEAEIWEAKRRERQKAVAGTVQKAGEATPPVEEEVGEGTSGKTAAPVESSPVESPIEETSEPTPEIIPEPIPKPVVPVSQEKAERKASREKKIAKKRTISR